MPKMCAHVYKPSSTRLQTNDAPPAHVMCTQYSMIVFTDHSPNWLEKFTIHVTITCKKLLHHEHVRVIQLYFRTQH